MSINDVLKTIARYMGFHVVRNYHNPAHTLMGLSSLPVGIVLDIGANKGQFAKQMRNRFSSATFHCFEPTPIAFECLRSWASTVDGVIAVNTALGDTTGIVEMHLHEDHDTSSSLLQTTDHGKATFPVISRQRRIKVNIERLDDYMACTAAQPRDQIFMKIDVQGYETSVLKGATETLKRVRACLIEVNVGSLYRNQSRFVDIVNILDAAGLVYAGNYDQNYNPNGTVSFLDAVFVRHDDFSGT